MYRRYKSQAQMLLFNLLRGSGRGPTSRVAGVPQCQGMAQTTNDTRFGQSQRETKRIRAKQGEWGLQQVKPSLARKRLE